MYTIVISKSFLLTHLWSEGRCIFISILSKHWGSILHDMNTLLQCEVKVKSKGDYEKKMWHFPLSTPETEIVFGRVSSMENHDSYLFLTELSQHPPFQITLLHEVHSPFLSGKKRRKEKKRKKGKKHSWIRNAYKFKKIVIFIYPYLFSIISALPDRKVLWNKEKILRTKSKCLDL